MTILKLTINFSTKKLNVSLDVDFITGTKFLIWVKDPLGATVYKNAGYDTEDFSIPDMEIPDMEYDTTSFKEVDLPLGVDNEILQGNYAVNVKWRRENVMSSAHCHITYCLKLPKIDLSLTYNCDEGKITSNDKTKSYKAYCVCTKQYISSEDRQGISHVLKYPVTTPTPIPDVRGTSEELSVTPLWTGRWASYYSYEVLYEMPPETIDDGRNSFSYFVTGNLLAHAYTDVVCEDDCVCKMFDCISNLTNKYFNELGRNEVLARKYERVLIQLNSLMLLYITAVQCDRLEEKDDICRRMLALINLSGCTCCGEEKTEESVLV